MNYLAHAYLSFEDPEILVGNMISDYIKGKKKFDYTSGIQKGISLHRIIDDYTDTHPATQEAKLIFRPVYRLYAGAFVDVSFDYFVANQHDLYLPEGLLAFSQRVYKILDQYVDVFPPAFQRMYPYMKMQNWLYYYQTKEGIEKSFGGLVRRGVYLTESESAIELFHMNRESLKNNFDALWSDLVPYTRNLYKSMT